jgi:phosphoribosylformylglycinamidine synthase
VDCPNRWVALDPERGAQAAVAEAARNLSCVGAEPLAVTDNLNFPSPETPKGFWQLAMACRGISDACRALNTPVTGGNVSLYNETKQDDGTMQPIHPTPVIGMVGGVDDISRVTGLAWQQPGDAIFLIGVPPEDGADPSLGLAGSAYQQQTLGSLAGRPPKPDLALEAAVGHLVREAIAQGLLASAHDCSDGGLAVALAESCIASDLGISVTLSTGSARLERVLFAEGGSRVIVSVNAASLPAWEQLSASNPALCVTQLGSVTAESRLVIRSESAVQLDLEVQRCAAVFRDALPRRMHSE